MEKGMGMVMVMGIVKETYGWGWDVMDGTGSGYENGLSSGNGFGSGYSDRGNGLGSDLGNTL